MRWFGRKPTWVSRSGMYGASFPGHPEDVSDLMDTDEAMMFSEKGITFLFFVGAVEEGVVDAKETLQSYCFGVSLAELDFSITDPNARVEGFPAILYRLGGRGHGVVLVRKEAVIDLRASAQNVNNNPFDNLKMVRFVNSFKNLV